MGSERNLSMVARATIAAMFISTVLGCLALDFGFDWPSLVRPVVPATVLALVSVFYTVIRPEPALAAVSIAMIDLVLFSAIGVQFTYIVAAMGGPLWDEYLFTFDRSLGLDWQAYLALANHYPLVALIGSIAYQSLQIQIILVVAVLGFGQQFLRLRRFVAAMVISGFATGILSGIMPAADAFVHLNPPLETYANLKPAAGFIHLHDFMGLRDGSLRTLSMTRTEGIITFPSFHTTLGLLFTWALWSVRWMRLPILSLNVALIAATPIDGGHYFADLFGGALLAVLSIAIVNLNVRSGRTEKTSVPALSSKAVHTTC